MGFSASIYLNFVQGQRATENKQAMAAQLADTTKRLEEAERAAKAKSTADGATTAKHITLTQLGVTLDRVDPINDLTYIYSQVNGDDIADLTTTSLLIQYPNCKPGSLGKLIRRSTKSSDTSGKLVKAIDGHGFYYVASSSGCASDAAGRALVKDARAAMTNLVLPTLAAK
jgi:hypothetical protein